MGLTLRQAAHVARIAPSTLLAHLDAGTGPRASYVRGPTGRREWTLLEEDVKAWAKARPVRVRGSRRRG